VPNARRLSSRSRWIGLTAKTKGSITIDAGAVRALHQNKSLLASGIVASTGDFSHGDPVAILDPEGKIVARGLTNYSQEDVEKIRGQRSSNFAVLLQTDSYYDEVIHRDDLVVESTTAIA
jgi:glutamate 5-kinase